MRLACALLFLIAALGCSDDKHGIPTPTEVPKVSADQLALKVDPYCGMSVENHPLAATADHKGKTYGFCSTFCKDEFVKDPEKYLAKVGQGAMK